MSGRRQEGVLNLKSP